MREIVQKEEPHKWGRLGLRIARQVLSGPRAPLENPDRKPALIHRDAASARRGPEFLSVHSGVEERLWPFYQKTDKLMYVSVLSKHETFTRAYIRLMSVARSPGLPG